ncbi:ferredoxin-type protein NapF [Albibacillus kandeliae]|uniref:ferredoxin-type protein NapF n=1 Tax=Albibacillus kandeliae TaxID=2174228 RepID=UPI000D68565B
MPAQASISRRQLLKGSPRPAEFRPRPPGVDLASSSACTGCGECVSACPERVLAITGCGVVLVPDQGECTFCGACAEVCEEPVFATDLRMTHTFAISNDCLVQAGITCMSCRDACPEEAISMQPRIGGPFVPVLDESACTGCGACVAPCPADAIHAVKKEPANA